MRWSSRIAASFVCLLGMAAASCATNPATGKKEITLMTEQQELELGRQAAAEVERQMPAYQDDRLQRYVSDIGMRLARASERPRLPWQFTIVDASAVNAFALPGGYVYITRGILPYLNDESELAGVLGHEIGHVTARHSVRQYTKQSAAELGLLTLGIFVPSAYPFTGLGSSALGVFFLKYSRDDEVEADRLGVGYAAEQGWDPHGVANMLTTLSRLDEATDRRGIPNWLSTHPQPEARVERVSATVKSQTGTRQDWTTNRDDYLQRLDGMIFGDDPDDGIVRDNVFLHPSMRLSVEFPLDWPINNGKEQVVAKNPSADEYMVLQMIERVQGRSLDEVADSQMSKMGWKPRSRGATKVNGLDAVLGVYEGSVSKLGSVTARVLHVAIGRRVFLLAGIAKRDRFAEADRQFAPALQTVRELSAREASGLRPNVVGLYTTVAGDSWQSIASKQSQIVRASTLAIINGHAVTDQPAAGEHIKIVVGGQ